MFEGEEMNTEEFANPQRGNSAQRLEGSRFIIRQPCKLAAGGSRERLLVVQFYRLGVNRSSSKPSRWVKALRWAVRGSRLLPSDRTATLQSGSPPGLGLCNVVFLKRMKRFES
jgi:hypothetical protein